MHEAKASHYGMVVDKEPGGKTPLPPAGYSKEEGYPWGIRYGWGKGKTSNLATKLLYKKREEIKERLRNSLAAMHGSEKGIPIDQVARQAGLDW